MDIRISGHQIDTGAALQEHAADRLGAIVDKYFDRAITSHVTFGKAPGGAFSCDIITHVMQGLILKAQGTAHDAHVAFDDAVEKIDKQLRRYKRRLRDHHRDRTAPVEFDGGSSYILAPTEEPEDIEADLNQPIVIAEMETKIPSITVGEAVMQLELGAQKMLVFRNEGHGGVNVVYRRDDGNIGWIDPRNSK